MNRRDLAAYDCYSIHWPIVGIQDIIDALLEIGVDGREPGSSVKAPLVDLIVHPRAISRRTAELDFSAAPTRGGVNHEGTYVPTYVKYNLFGVHSFNLRLVHRYIPFSAMDWRTLERLPVGGELQGEADGGARRRMRRRAPFSPRLKERAGYAAGTSKPLLGTPR
jgi:hypothetical protein